MTFSRQILFGLGLGVATGLFFGEAAASLKWAADGFVKLLQMMVLPYITVSIIGSIGSLRASEVRTLGLRAAAVIGGLWLLALSFAFLIPVTFPADPQRIVLQHEPDRAAPAFDLIDLYIPANPFNSLANNVVRPSSCSRSSWGLPWSAFRTGNGCSMSCTSPGCDFGERRAS